MTTKEEALKLADELDALHQYVPSEAPAMIRRLVGELNKYKTAWNMVEIELEKAEERNLKIVRKNENLLAEFFRVKEELNCDEDYIKQYQLQTKPLSDDEIMNTFENCLFDGGFNAIEFARAIEERHGIK